ncbi:MAG: MoaD/ThiS family protein [Dokdonella sp.]|uniref:MoaD/ThiS family protein n=1 Tax=Dokdonella sp. TaxID=2291710 RepID=UPI003265BFA5
MNIRLLYFASLADRAGVATETRQTSAATLRALYAEVSEVHAFSMAVDRLRVAVNGAFVGWEHAPADNDEVVFLPPVSGG